MRFVTRAEWGGRKPRSVMRIPGPVTSTTFHWEGPGMGAYGHESCASKIRGIQNFHMDSRGWSDIAYNAIVCRHGYVYEGRWIGVRSAAQGTEKGNDTSYAICGLFGEGDALTDLMKDAYLDCRAYFIAAAKAGTTINPHSFWHSTACPGPSVRSWISGGAPDPIPDTPPAPPAGDPTPTDKAVALAFNHDGAGVWTFAADGGVFTEGSAAFHGGMGGQALNAPIVSGEGHGDGGYWLAAADGGVFTFGDAPFAGSAGGLHLNSPIVAMEATPSRNGYWLVAGDGGVFAFGDAGYFGSTGGMSLNYPISAFACRPQGDGYWMAAKDGGVFCFGAAGFHGSLGGVRLNAPVVAIIPTRDGLGYWMVGADGGVFAFGNAQPVSPYVPLFQQYASGARRVVAAERGPNGGFVLLSNLGERYVLGFSG